MKFGVVVFPGSNCDEDTRYVLETVLGQEVVMLWHRETDLHGVQAVILPGGFSYGDYLRSGALARFSPIMQSIRRHADAGGVVLGICNGFQILQEAGLLPGAMLPNSGLKFICRPLHVRVEEARGPFTSAASRGQVLCLPVAHNEGNFYASAHQLRDLEENRQILLRYCDARGECTADSNPNGSLDHIAAVTNRAGNVMGLMPHPERASEAALGSRDGLALFQSMVCHLEGSA